MISLFQPLPLLHHHHISHHIGRRPAHSLPSQKQRLHLSIVIILSSPRYGVFFSVTHHHFHMIVKNTTYSKIFLTLLLHHYNQEGNVVLAKEAINNRLNSQSCLVIFYSLFLFPYQVFPSKLDADIECNELLFELAVPIRSVLVEIKLNENGEGSPTWEKISSLTTRTNTWRNTYFFLNLNEKIDNIFDSVDCFI